MRIIYLNCWHGKREGELPRFLNDWSHKTDIFCFQESDPETYSKFEKTLRAHKGFYSEKEYIKGQKFTISSFVNKNLDFNLIDFACSKDVGCCLSGRLNIKNKQITVTNIHGLSLPGDKLDTKARIKQSREVIDFHKDKNSLNIIGGDFNLLPNTKSIKMFEDSGYKNLITDFGIKMTRNHFAWEQAEHQLNTEGRDFFGKQLFADYCFVSPNIKIRSFEVPNLEISDHLPLILDFDI